MKKSVLSTLAAALLCGVISPCFAQDDSPSEMKPVAVFSLAGYQELRSDVAMVGKLAGQPRLADALEGMLALVTQGRGLAGIDKKKPWGAVMQTDGSKLSGYACLPVSDLDAFGDLMEPLVDKIEDLGDGVYKVEKDGKTLYARHKDSGWLFACEKAEWLADTPDDPGKLFGRLSKQYDVAVRLNLRNVPAEHRKKFIAKLREDAAKELKQKPGEDELEYAIRKQVGQSLLNLAITVAKDLDRVILGWSLDSQAEKAVLDLSATARRGSKTAQALAETAAAKTHFGGFRMPGAVMTASGALQCPHVDAERMAALFALIRTKVEQDIDASQSEEEAKVAKQLAGGLLEVVEKTIASGRADGAVAVLLKPESATMVAGRFIADVPKLEETADQLVEAVRAEHPDFVAKVLKTDVDRYKDIHFHTLSVPLPEEAKNRDQIVRLVGETLEVVVGFGPESVYLAAGRDAMQTLKQAIRQSETEAAGSAPPMEFSVSLGQIAKFMAATTEGKTKQRAEKALAALQGTSGDDRVKLTAVPIRRGMTLRLEVEPAVLKMIGAARPR